MSYWGHTRAYLDGRIKLDVWSPSREKNERTRETYIVLFHCFIVAVHGLPRDLGSNHCSDTKLSPETAVQN